MSVEAKRQVPCKWVGEDGEECDGTVLVELEFIPGEWFGTDADGNRGIWQSEYWAFTNVADTCTKGHKVEWDKEYGQEAEEYFDKHSYDYDGPDTLEERDGDV